MLKEKGMNMDFISHQHSHCISVTADEVLRLVAEEWGTRCDGRLWWEDGEPGGALCVGC